MPTQSRPKALKTGPSRLLLLLLAFVLLSSVRYVASVVSRVTFAAPQIQDATALTPEQAKAFADAWVQQPRVDLGIPAGSQTLKFRAAG